MDTPVEWTVFSEQLDYQETEAAMEERARLIHEGTAREAVWLLEHPPLITAGTSAKIELDLANPGAFPVHKTSRGGQLTYHGPGQRVVYFMLDLSRRGRDVRQFVATLEDLIIDALSDFGVRAERREDRVGVWVDRSRPGAPPREDKIAAIGIRLRKWVSFHGIAINVEPDLSHFEAIVPCGISDPRYGVTSLVDLGIPATMDDLDTALQSAFKRLFGPTDVEIATDLPELEHA
ncbi:MAG: lipoyl(octanoyl) transferase LipB [Pseudomonadota bacterium]